MNEADPSNDSLSALTEDTIRAFARAVVGANSEYQQFAVIFADRYQHMDRGDRTSILRGLLKGWIAETTGEQADIKVVTINGIFGVVIDRSVFVHLKKLETSLIAEIPKTLSEAKKSPQQFRLPGFEDEVEPSLGEMDHVVGGYLKDEVGLIKEFHFTKQEGQLVIEDLKVELPDQVISLFEEDDVQSDTKITLKKIDSDKEGLATNE